LNKKIIDEDNVCAYWGTLEQLFCDPDCGGWVACEGHYYSAPCVHSFIFYHHNEGDLEIEARSSRESNYHTNLKSAMQIQCIHVTLDTPSSLPYTLSWGNVFYFFQCITLYYIFIICNILFSYIKNWTLGLTQSYQIDSKNRSEVCTYL